MENSHSEKRILINLQREIPAHPGTFEPRVRAHRRYMPEWRAWMDENSIPDNAIVTRRIVGGAEITAPGEHDGIRDGGSSRLTVFEVLEYDPDDQ